MRCADAAPIAAPLFVESAAARARVHPRQRRDRAVLHGRADGRRRGAVRLRQRRRPRRLSRAGRAVRRQTRRPPDRAAGCSATTDRRAGRQADAPLHRRHRARRRGAPELRHGCGRRRLRQRRLPRPLRHRRSAPTRCSTNNGNGTFTDVTREAGVSDALWSTSAAFVDYDRDGDLDLFVANYVDFTPAGNKVCHDSRRRARLLQPARVPARARTGCIATTGTAASRTSRNRRASAKADGAGLGVADGDYNGDGWLDIYVANDATPNQLWINRHDGTFVDEGPALGRRARTPPGNPEGSMGIASGDFDRDGDEDLFVTNIVGETFALYVNDGHGNFEDARGAHRPGGADGGVHRLRHRLVRLRQRRLARSVRRQRRRQHHRGAARAAVAVPACAISCFTTWQGAFRGDERRRRAGIRARRDRPRRGVRRHRQRRRRRRRRHEQRRARAGCCSTSRTGRTTGSRSARVRIGGTGLPSAHGSAWSSPNLIRVVRGLTISVIRGRRCGAACGRTAAICRPATSRVHFGLGASSADRGRRRAVARRPARTLHRRRRRPRRDAAPRLGRWGLTPTAQLLCHWGQTPG